MTPSTKSKRYGWVLGLLLACHAVLLALSGWWQSPTLNEPGHLVAGLHHWATGEFTLYRVNPPLVRLVASLPTALAGYQADWSGYYEFVGARPVFEMGEDFIAANGRRSMLYFRLARWVCIPFSLLGAWVCFAWARDLFGNASGLMATTLWCFSPMVLGHASMIAPDAHATSLGLAACYTFWRWLRTPTWRQAALTGLVLGLAELSKTTMILFYPLWPLLWLLDRWPDRGVMTLGRWRDEAGMLLLRMLIGLYVLNLGYLGEGSFTKLKEFRFTSHMLGGTDSERSADAAHSADRSRSAGGNRFDRSWFGGVPVPLPANYVVGIDVQQRDFEDFSRPSYLRGQYKSTGWWYYYLYAIAVKAPLGTLGLIALAAVTSCIRYGPRLKRRDGMILLTPAVVIFIVASSKFGFSHHSRYILPCVPFVFIWISGLARHLVWSEACPDHSRWLGLVMGVLLSWTTLSSLRVYPHSISYFNEASGGPAAGPEHLLNSNIDWGQDLLFLERWIEQNKDKHRGPVHLAYYGYFNPFDLDIEGIQSWPLTPGRETVEVPPGLYAISVNLLYEFPWMIRNVEGNRSRVEVRPLAFLRHQRPIGRAGYSVRIYSAEQVRRGFAASPSPSLGER